MKLTLLSLPLIFLLLYASTLHAQSPVTGIAYTYDASGNRIHRAPSTIAARKANPDTANTAGQKDTAVFLVQNNIVASFTPNPTTTGNFVILVQKYENAISSINPNTQPQEVKDNIAYVSVFNALGELIQFKTTQLDKPLNIDLSAFSKGIYLVKVLVRSAVEGQNGENVILHRMAYQ